MYVGIQLVAGLAGLLAQVMLARWLGVEWYGMVGLALALSALCAIPAALGSEQAALRFLPGYARQPALQTGFARIAVAAVLVGSGAAFLLLLLLSSQLPSHTSAAYGQTLAWAAWLMWILPLQALTSAVARVRGSAWMAVAPPHLFRPFALLALAGGALHFALSAEPTWAIAAVWLAAAAAVALQAPPVIAMLRGSGDDKAQYDLAAWRGAAWAFLLSAAAAAAFPQILIVVVGAASGAEQAAYYLASFKLAALLAMTLTGANVLAAPLFARLQGEAKPEALQQLCVRLSHLSFWPALAMGGLLVAGGERALGLFGEAFAVAYPVLLVLTGAQLVNAAAGPVATICQMTGDHQFVMRTLAIAALAASIAAVGLAALFGALGAAWAFVLYTAGWNLVLYRRARSRLDVAPSIIDRLPAWRRGR